MKARYNTGTHPTCSCSHNLPCGVDGQECDNCGFWHELDKCCECGAGATGEGRFAYLCADHAYEAYEDERADRS